MRYFFDIFDGDHWTRDDLGIDLETDAKARQQSVLALCEMAREQIPGNGPYMDLAIRVRTGPEVLFSTRLDFTTDVGPALNDPDIGIEIVS